MTAVNGMLPAGVLVPESVLSSGWFAILAAFVAINTVMYAALAIARILPRIYRTDWFSRPNQRKQTRSIYPDTPIVPQRPTPLS